MSIVCVVVSGVCWLLCVCVLLLLSYDGYYVSLRCSSDVCWLLCLCVLPLLMYVGCCESVCCSSVSLVWLICDAAPDSCSLL